MFDAVAYLASKGLRGKSASGGRELTLPCFFDCGEPPNSSKRKLYVNVEDGVFNCKVCGASGGPYSLQQHFGDNPRAGTSDDAWTRRRILDWAAETGATMLSNNDPALLYLLNERGLGAETVIERKFGFVGDGWSLTGSLPGEFTREQLKATGLVHREGARAGEDFFYRHLLIPIIHHGHVIQIRGRIWGESRGGKYMSGPGEPVRAYNLDSLDGAEEAILTEGEFDAARLAEVLQSSTEERARRLAVVGLPGTDAWPGELDDYLAHLKRIFIGFDADEPGKRAAAKLQEKLGPRARVVELPFAGTKCDWTEYLLPARNDIEWENEHPYAGHGAGDVLRLMSQAAGKRIHSVAEAGAAFREYRGSNPGLQTGWREFDGLIRPGLLPGQVMFVLAKTGVGKTNILCNLAYQMRKHRILFVSLEMTREEVYHRMERVYLFHHPRATTIELEQQLGTLYICDENRLGERDLQALINEYRIEVGANPDLVLIDYLGYYARGARGSSPYEKSTNAAMQLKAEAKAARLVIIAPSQVNRVAKDGKPIDLDDARDSGAIEETGDFVLAAYRPETAEVSDAVNVRPTYKMKIQVLKSRHGGVGKVFTLQMDALCLVLVEDGTRAAKVAEEHNVLAWRGKSWEDLRAEQTRPQQLTIRGARP